MGRVVTIFLTSALLCNNQVVIGPYVALLANIAVYVKVKMPKAKDTKSKHLGSSIIEFINLQSFQSHRRSLIMILKKPSVIVDLPPTASAEQV